MMLSESDLGQFTGSENYFQHWLKVIYYTEGLQYLAEQGEAYWLIDAIASYQNRKILSRYPELVDFQLWELTVNKDKSALLICRADSDRFAASRREHRSAVVSQNIEFTDFPLAHIKLYLCNHVLMLPSEY